MYRYSMYIMYNERATSFLNRYKLQYLHYIVMKTEG